VGKNVIEYVDNWPHLGHILSNKVKSDNEDIRRCYLSLVKQINEMLCYFRNLGVSTKLNLLYSYCSSLYGTELWDLSNSDFECICIAWRKALKRVYSLPWRTHSNILYSLCNKWRIEDEIYRRTLLFGLRCINSESLLVRFVSRYSINYGLMHSILGRNILVGCQRYGLKVCDFLTMSPFFFKGNRFFKLFNENNEDVVNPCVINLLNESILLRDQDLICSGLDFSQLTYIISFICCS